MFCGSKFPMVFLHPTQPERWKTFFDSRMSPAPLVRWTAGNFNGSNRLSRRSIYRIYLWHFIKYNELIYKILYCKWYWLEFKDWPNTSCSLPILSQLPSLHDHRRSAPRRCRRSTAAAAPGGGVWCPVHRRWRICCDPGRPGTGHRPQSLDHFSVETYWNTHGDGWGSPNFWRPP